MSLVHCTPKRVALFRKLSTQNKDFLLQIGFGQQSWACGNSSHTRAQLNKNYFKKPTAACFSYRAQFLGHLQMN